MSIPYTLNTYGIRSINAKSFNTYGAEEAHIPLSLRNLATTLLRINNLAFNILGYIPGIAQVSGCFRMGIGTCIIVLTLALGSPTADKGLIIGHWYKETLLTGVTQIARGALEALIPYGSLVNMPLDIVGTVFNLTSEISCHTSSSYYNIFQYEECSCGPIDIYQRKPDAPHLDPDYPFFLFPLYLA